MPTGIAVVLRRPLIALLLTVSLGCLVSAALLETLRPIGFQVASVHTVAQIVTLPDSLVICTLESLH